MSDVQTQLPAVPLNRFGGLLLVLVVVTLVLVYPPFAPEASPLAGLFIVQFLIANLAVVVGLLGAVLPAPEAPAGTLPTATIWNATTDELVDISDATGADYDVAAPVALAILTGMLRIHGYTLDSYELTTATFRLPDDRTVTVSLPTATTPRYDVSVDSHPHPTPESDALDDHVLGHVLPLVAELFPTPSSLDAR